ncbi:MAG TPA: hypothetical protein VN495_01555 [Candidatus Paceibacterota bacterium]|nr:hypothetical protein [Candidatus Paceibacterota bacterium]
MAEILRCGDAIGVIIDDRVHVLKPSKSRYILRFAGVDLTYGCMCEKCDGGLTVDVRELLRMASLAGATAVVIRKAPRPALSDFSGLTVLDPEELRGAAHREAVVLRT